ncbi:hypothetical protein B0H10DRAFT_1967550 [Mycena sp. CBHHK59/15]|nr:hypothetical protein B0H10DRAFT_1967550 [Mycena sp. CBHHK59/15]
MALNSTDSDDVPDVLDASDNDSGDSALREDPDVGDHSELIVDDLMERLQCMVLRFRLDPPVESDEDARESMRKASQILSILLGQLPPLRAILPSKNISWPQTAAVMGVPVKSKKHKDYGPYGGGEPSRKKARLDARGPLEPSLLDNKPVATQTAVQLLPMLPIPSEPSYYCPRAYTAPLLPAPPTDTSPLPSPSTRPAARASTSRPSFDVETFDLRVAKDDDLSSLNANQLRALCAKYNVELTRGNDVMVSHLCAYRLKLQNPPQPRPTAVPNPYPYAYPPSQHYSNYFYPVYSPDGPTQ